MRTTDVQVEPTTEQDYRVEVVPNGALPGAQSWAMARDEQGTYLFIEESPYLAAATDPTMWHQIWGAYRWIATHRPHPRPNVPVIPSQAAAAGLTILEAVMLGHALGG